MSCNGVHTIHGKMVKIVFVVLFQSSKWGRANGAWEDGDKAIEISSAHSMQANVIALICQDPH